MKRLKRPNFLDGDANVLWDAVEFWLDLAAKRRSEIVLSPAECRALRPYIAGEVQRPTKGAGKPIDVDQNLKMRERNIAIAYFILLLRKANVVHEDAMGDAVDVFKVGRTVCSEAWRDWREPLERGEVLAKLSNEHRAYLIERLRELESPPNSR
jgi:hypothetical protein